LQAIARHILEAESKLAAANTLDLQAVQNSGLDAALMDRLTLTQARIRAMAEGLQQVATLTDPVGEISHLAYRPSGIRVGRMRVPIGVIGIIYESRPNVTADAAALCLKAGNACILRGGSEALNSNLAIAQCIHEGLEEAGPAADDGAGVAVERPQPGRHGAQNERQHRHHHPAGGKSLIERVAKESEIPVLKHLDGICHVYIDDKADLEMAKRVAFNAKTYRYGICGAMETLLVAERVARTVLPDLAAQYRKAGVELRGCKRSRGIVPDMLEATEADWSTDIWRRSSPSKWSTAWTRPSRTSSTMDRIIPMPSSPRITRAHNVSCVRWIPVP
jgi:glutamate-5-semialdehyde dehydrogenase